MKIFIRILTKIYFYILHLYPASYRKTFQEEILLDFKDMLTDASKEGIFSLIAFCLREARDIPPSLASTHLEENRMMSIIRSQPLTNGLRGALGFGVAFAIANIISMLVWLNLGWSDNSVVSRLQVFYFDLFHTEHGLELISWIPSAISSLLTGLVMGILFALLFGVRSRYPKSILIGMLGWFLQDAVRSILGHAFNLPVFLSNREYAFFSDMTLVLSGAFLGLIFIVVKSERPGPFRLLVLGAFAYPLIAYLYVKQVFNSLIFSTPWRFIALAILMVIFIGSVFFIAMKSDAERKLLWVIVAGAIGRLIVTYFVYFIGRFIWPMPFWGILHDEPIFWPFELSLAASNAIYGILFGSLLGLVLGLQKKIVPPQIQSTA